MNHRMPRYALTLLAALALCLLSGEAQGQETPPPPAETAEVQPPVAPDDADAAGPEPEAATPADERSAFEKRLDAAFDKVNGWIAPVLFFDVSLGGVPDGIPLIVLVLLLGGMFFTFRFGLINLRLFPHAFSVIRGKFDNPNDHGEVSHFQALTSALSATVGLGNIAGVALAITGAQATTGGTGAGAIFWMWMVAFFGMSSKFASCTLAQAYRQISDEDPTKHREHVLGGPMIYLAHGMKDVFGKGFGGPFGKVLAISFAIFAIGGSLGGGNMFQSNQTARIFSFVLLDGDESYAWLFGVGMASMVGLVIVGGIRRIGEVTCRIVPAMCVFYCLVCLVILTANISAVPGLIGAIFTEAWDIESMGWGGFGALMALGIKRGAFSNEAGLGSAAIAHSAAKTAEPVREGVVGMVGPFIDTIVVCTMTALTILITQGQYADELLSGSEGWVRGAAMTAAAFGTLHGYLPILLCVAVFVFAYSTMISWGYYGERAVEYLFGKRGIWPFRIVFLLFVVMGPMVSISNVLDFTDLLILSMAYPNVLGVIILSPKVARLAKDYVRRLKSGEMKPYDKNAAEGEPSI